MTPGLRDRRRPAAVDAPDCGATTLYTIRVGASCSAFQQQYFRTVPRNLRVREGGEAVLECAVANLAGQVQWAKDGFALGFSSIIPGYPRYTMIGDRRLGVYNLRIVNATLEDDAEYQCQVGPAQMHKVIRANATLAVIDSNQTFSEGHKLASSGKRKKKRDGEDVNPIHTSAAPSGGVTRGDRPPRNKGIVPAPPREKQISGTRFQFRPPRNSATIYALFRASDLRNSISGRKLSGKLLEIPDVPPIWGYVREPFIRIYLFIYSRISRLAVLLFAIDQYVNCRIFCTKSSALTGPALGTRHENLFATGEIIVKRPSARQFRKREIVKPLVADMKTVLAAPPFVGSERAARCTRCSGRLRESELQAAARFKFYTPTASSQQHTDLSISSIDRWTFLRSERTREPPESMRSSSPIDTLNPREITDALLPSWVGIGYLVERERADERSGPPEISFAARNEPREGMSSRMYSVRV
ncbi:Nephrin [Eumeta japonica]|uniref:Nephrin n=1 Tax=Eumeta variegata TaxID=151549 RepID=A0A4C1Y6F5_EUMVA|nr:Nephrin [Eumeta japonica]